MTDHDAIRDLQARYCHLIDNRDMEAWAALFTDDGRFSFPGFPPAHPRDVIPALRANAEALAKAGSFGKHHTLNTAISINGDTATCQSDLMLLRLDNGVTRIHAIGRYNDRLRKGASGWRFEERVASFHADQTPAGWAVPAAG